MNSKINTEKDDETTKIRTKLISKKTANNRRVRRTTGCIVNFGFNPTTRKEDVKGYPSWKKRGGACQENLILSVPYRFTKVKLKVMSLIFKTPSKEKFLISFDLNLPSPTPQID